MTQAEFISRLDELKRHARPVFWWGAALVFLFEALVIYYILHLYPHARAALPWYFAGFIVMFAAVIAFAVLLRRITVRFAPACPACGAPATWRDRAQVLSSGRCPKCGSEFVQINA
ncbi:MAG: hypothetical protein ACM36A_00665 [Bacteroidota bacterium]